MLSYLKQYKLFRNLKEKLLLQLVELSEMVELDSGEVLIREGERSHDLFLLVEGELDVLKSGTDGEMHTILKKKSVDLIGEMGFIEYGKRATTIQAAKNSKVIKINGSKLSQDPKFLELDAEINLAIARIVSNNLRYTNEVTVKAMKSELESAKKIIEAGRMMATIVLLASAYIFLFNIIISWKKHFSTTPISVGILVLFAVICFFAIRKSAFGLESYGLTLKHWKKDVKEAIYYSIPFLIIAVVAKYLFINFLPEYAEDSLFQPFEDMRRQGIYSPLMVAVFTLAYVVFCPIQEFIGRGVLQSSFHMFLGSGDRRSVWLAILFSNLIFSAMHVHLSISFALVTFFPGLFWGWIFAKQRRLVGVSVSHILIGYWAISLVGFRVLI